MMVLTNAMRKKRRDMGMNLHSAKFASCTHAQDAGVNSKAQAMAPRPCDEMQTAVCNANIYMPIQAHQYH